MLKAFYLEARRLALFSFLQNFALCVYEILYAYGRAASAR